VIQIRKKKLSLLLISVFSMSCNFNLRLSADTVPFLVNFQL